MPMEWPSSLTMVLRKSALCRESMLRRTSDFAEGMRLTTLTCRSAGAPAMSSAWWARLQPWSTVFRAGLATGTTHSSVGITATSRTSPRLNRSESSASCTRAK